MDERVDLSAVALRIRRLRAVPYDRASERTLAIGDAPALVAELGAARETVETLRIENGVLRKLQPVAWSAIQAMREIERQMAQGHFQAAASTIRAYLASIDEHDQTMEQGAKAP